MADDKFLDIINKLKNDEQPVISSPSTTEEGLRALNEGLKNNTFSLDKNNTVKKNSEDNK